MLREKECPNCMNVFKYQNYDAYEKIVDYTTSDGKHSYRSSFIMCPKCSAEIEI